MKLSDDEIRGFILTLLELLQDPCHTQAVERGIKVVSEAASAVIGEEARDGFIRQKLLSRMVSGRCDMRASFFLRHWFDPCLTSFSFRPIHFFCPFIPFNLLFSVMLLDC